MSNQPSDSNERLSKGLKVDQLDEYIDPEERVEYLDTGRLSGLDEHELNQEAPGEDVTDEMLREDVHRPDSWLHFNKGLEQTGYAPCEALTPENVDELERAWEYEVDSAGMQTSPTIVPGDGETPPVMYFGEMNTHIHAVNAHTGEEYWTYKVGYTEEQQEGPDAISPRFRGVAVYEDKVYLGTADIRMIALNRYTGEKVWETDAMVPELEELPFTFYGYGFSDAPVVYDGMVYCGQVCGDVSLMGHTYAMAFDAETGDLEWYTRMAPKNEWLGDTWKHANASPWMSPAIDAESDTVFWNSGNPRPMMNPMVRPGPNQMSAGIVAFDAKTGEVKWNDQMSPQDHWDYDGQFTPSVVNVEVAGEERRAVVADHKSGWTFVYDVETGQILSRSVPFAEQSDDHHGFIGHGEENATEIWPGAAGGTNYPADGLSPKTGYRYVGSSDTGEMMWMDDFTYPEEGVGTPGMGTDGDGEDDVSGGGRGPVPGLNDEVEFSAHVTAVDMRTGDHAWRTELPDTEDVTNHTFLMYPGGTTATGGNLVFSGSSGGHLYALNAETGELLWEDDTEQRITSTPIAWGDPHEEAVYVAVASSDKVITYKADVDFAAMEDDDPDEEGNDDEENGDEAEADEPEEEEEPEEQEVAGTDDDDDPDDDGTPGFGFLAALAGVGAGAAAAKRLNSSGADDEQ